MPSKVIYTVNSLDRKGRDPVTTQAQIQALAQDIRRRVLEYTISDKKGGYLSQACSSAEILSVLYGGLMTLGESEGPMIPPPLPDDPGAMNHDGVTGGIYYGARSAELDRFIVSPTHYALVIYGALVALGRMAPEGLYQFNSDGSRVEMIGEEHSPGLEVTGGSFGQAISQAAGIAIARRIKGDSGRVWVFMSDGEFQEGQTWESFAVMAFHKVDNLTVFVDVNGQQVDGRMSEVMDMGNLADKLRAFGAEVVEVDGHDIDALMAAGQMRPTGKPLVVLGHTNPYQGIPLLASRYPNLHFVRFKSEEEREQYREFMNTMQAEAVS